MLTRVFDLVEFWPIIFDLFVGPLERCIRIWMMMRERPAVADEVVVESSHPPNT